MSRKVKSAKGGRSLDVESALASQNQNALHLMDGLIDQVNDYVNEVDKMSEMSLKPTKEGLNKYRDQMTKYTSYSDKYGAYMTSLFDLVVVYNCKLAKAGEVCLDVIDSLFVDQGVITEMSHLAEAVRKSIAGNLSQISENTAAMRLGMLEAMGAVDRVRRMGSDFSNLQHVCEAWESYQAFKGKTEDKSFQIRREEEAGTVVTVDPLPHSMLDEYVVQMKNKGDALRKMKEDTSGGESRIEEFTDKGRQLFDEVNALLDEMKKKTEDTKDLVKTMKNIRQQVAKSKESFDKRPTEFGEMKQLFSTTNEDISQFTNQLEGIKPPKSATKDKEIALNDSRNDHKVVLNSFIRLVLAHVREKTELFEKDLDAAFGPKGDIDDIDKVVGGHRTFLQGNVDLINGLTIQNIPESQTKKERALESIQGCKDKMETDLKAKDAVRQTKTLLKKIECFVNEVGKKKRNFETEVGKSEKAKSEPNVMLRDDLLETMNKTEMKICDLKNEFPLADHRGVNDAILQFGVWRRELNERYAKVRKIYERDTLSAEKERMAFQGELNKRTADANKSFEVYKHEMEARTQHKKQIQANAEFLFERKYQETLAAISTGEQKVRSMKIPRRKFNADVKEMLGTLDKWKEECTEMKATWEKYKTPLEIDLVFMIAEGVSGTDLIPESSRGLACVIKGREITKSNFVCDTEDLMVNSTNGLDLLSNIIKVEPRGGKQFIQGRTPAEEETPLKEQETSLAEEPPAQTDADPEQQAEALDESDGNQDPTGEDKDTEEWKECFPQDRLWITLPFSDSANSKSKSPVVMFKTGSDQKWTALDSKYTIHEDMKCLECMVHPCELETFYVTVSAESKKAVYHVGKSPSNVESLDGKFTMDVVDGCFDDDTEMSIESVDVPRECHRSCQRRLPPRLALTQLDSSPIFNLGVGNPLTKSNMAVWQIARATRPKTAGVTSSKSKDSQATKERAKSAVTTAEKQEEPCTSLGTHFVVKRKNEPWSYIKDMGPASRSGRTKFEVKPEFLDHNEAKLLFIQTDFIGTPNDIIEIADGLEAAATQYICSVIVRQHENDNRRLYTTVCHKPPGAFTMSEKPVLEMLKENKFTDGPQLLGPEFYLSEGEELVLAAEGNIKFDAGDPDCKMMKFHSNLKTTRLETMVTHRDQYGQHARDKYQGKLVYIRKCINEKICDFGLQLTKLDLHKPHGSIQARNCNGVLTDDFLDEIVEWFVPVKEQLASSLHLSRRDLEKLYLKYEDEEDEQVFHMIRNQMKKRHLTDKFGMAKKLHSIAKMYGLAVAEEKLEDRIYEMQDQHNKHLYDEKMAKTLSYLKTSGQTLGGWKAMYRELMLGKKHNTEAEADITEISADYHADIKEQLHQAVLRWRETVGDYREQYKDIIRVLYRLNWTQVADKVADVWGVTKEQVMSNRRPKSGNK